MDEPHTQSVASTTHSFIVKLWLDEADEVHGHPKVRGHITHVPSGERHYFTNLGAILDFIEPYLAPVESPPGRRRRTGRWLRLWKRLAGRKT